MCASDNASEVGPELPAATKAPIEPEPLVRDESLRKTGSIREWDKGKTPVYGMYLPTMMLIISNL